MTKDRTCLHCQSLFHDIEGKVFANHVRWCKKNTENGDKGVSKVAQKTVQRNIEKLGHYRDFDVSCQKCMKTFSVREREKKHPARNVYFCSRRCANTRGPRSEDFKEKVRLKLALPKKVKQCEHCFSTFECASKKRFCSRNCASKARCSLDKSSLAYYRQQCAFKFGIRDFPEEFDFSLIEKHGWYSAKNRGNNLSGVSRDHIVSIRFGFDNKIDPEIISHPANCQLLVHGENVTKGTSCGASLEELKVKIEAWNRKYRTSIKHTV